MRLRGVEQINHSNQQDQQQQQQQQQQYQPYPPQQQQAPQFSRQPSFHHQQINNPETITIHCELHPDLDDSADHWSESDPQSTIKMGSTLRGLDPSKHTPAIILQAWSRHQNHPENDWELIVEGHPIDSDSLPPNETLRNLGIKDGDRFWVRSSGRGGSNPHQRQNSSLPGAFPPRFEQERSLRPAPLSSESPHIFPGPLDTSRALGTALHSGTDGTASTNGGTTPTSSVGGSSHGSASAFALTTSLSDGNNSPAATLFPPPPPPPSQGPNLAGTAFHLGTSASRPQRESTSNSTSNSNFNPVSSQKHPRASSPDSNPAFPASYQLSSSLDGSSKRRKPSPAELAPPSLGFTGSAATGEFMDHGSLGGPNNATTSNFHSRGSSTGVAGRVDPVLNKTTAKIQRYETSISDLWGGDAWQNEVLVPSFAPVSKGKDAVRAVQQLAKLTPGEGGPGGLYPTRVKNAIVHAMQSRISRNKLASQKTTIPDLQEAFALLKTQGSGVPAFQNQNSEAQSQSHPHPQPQLSLYPQAPRPNFREKRPPDHYSNLPSGSRTHPESHSDPLMGAQHQHRARSQENYDYSYESPQTHQN